VTGISPASGSSTGGDTVIITGTGFIPGYTRVYFGSSAAAVATVDSGTQLTATSPPGSGTVDITVMTPAGPSASGTIDQFTYHDPGIPS
jgi:hypothetical protein